MQGSGDESSNLSYSIDQINNQQLEVKKAFPNHNLEIGDIITKSDSEFTFQPTLLTRDSRESF